MSKQYLKERRAKARARQKTSKNVVIKDTPVEAPPQAPPSSPEYFYL